MSMTFYIIMMTILFVIMILFLFAISSINNNRKNKEEKKQTLLDEFNQKISSRKEILLKLEKDIQNKSINKSVSLSNQVVKVLDIYDQSNIKIPADIIEDLSVMNFDSDDEIKDYIENQRYFWKLENSKKPFIRK